MRDDYEIEVGREELVWRQNMKDFRTKDLVEAVLYMKDTFSNICNKIGKNLKSCVILIFINIEEYIYKYYLLLGV